MLELCPDQPIHESESPDVEYWRETLGDGWVFLDTRDTTPDEPSAEDILAANELVTAWDEYTPTKLANLMRRHPLVETELARYRVPNIDPNINTAELSIEDAFFCDANSYRLLVKNGTGDEAGELFQRIAIGRQALAVGEPRDVATVIVRLRSQATSEQFAEWRVNADAHSDAERAALAVLDIAAAYQVLFHCNLRLAAKVAHDFTAHVPKHFFMDALQEACVAMSRSIWKFNPQGEARFSTFATQGMLRAIRRNLCGVTQAVALSESDYEVMSKVVEAYTANPYLELEELAKETGLAPHDLERLLRASWSDSLDRSVVEDDGLVLGDTVSAPGIDAEAEANRLAAAEVLTSIIANASMRLPGKPRAGQEHGAPITDLQRCILGLYFGLGPEALGGSALDLGNGNRIDYSSLHQTHGQLSAAEIADLLHVEGLTERHVIGQIIKITRALGMDNRPNGYKPVRRGRARQLQEAK